MLSGCKSSAVRGPALILDPAQFTIAVEDGSIAIGWDPVPKAEYYVVSRAGSRLGEYTVLETVTDTRFTDTQPNPDKYENYYRVAACVPGKDGGAKELSARLISLELKMFGPTMLFYDAKYDNIIDIEEEINRIHDTETLGKIIDKDGRTGEFTSVRYGMYFKPGEYKGFEYFRIGFYTQAAGLGGVPTQTKLHGTIETPPHLANRNATCTFWRGIENIEITRGQFHWAVSQAAPVRRMKVHARSDFDWGGWASGGYTGDCYFVNAAGSWTQQQWYMRNSHFEKGYFGVNWNKFSQGSTGDLEDSNWDVGGVTTRVVTTPIIREKPFLFLEDGEYKVFVPAIRKEATGVSWTDTDMGPGAVLDLVQDFYVARAGADSASSINAALAAGKHIFFTPGRYGLDAPLHVQNAGTIILGTGFATLYPGPTNRFGAIYVDDVPNVTIAGLMLDALYNSAYLICVGPNDASADHSAAPTLLADLFLRIGGYQKAKVNVDVAAIVNSNDVIGDHFWIWRADHGAFSSQYIGWDINTSKNGLIVTGDRVTMYGLFVEHFLEYQTIWMGDNGRMYFYQCESPYDPFDQAGYRSHNGTVDGWAGYKVANNVDNHLAVGVGYYAVFNKTGRDRKKSQSIFVENAVEVPNKPGVMVQHALIIEISGNDTEKVQTGVRNIVNGTGIGVGGKYGHEKLLSYNDGTGIAIKATKANDHPDTQPDIELLNETGTQPGEEDIGKNIPARLLP